MTLGSVIASRLALPIEDHVYCYYKLFEQQVNNEFSNRFDEMYWMTGY